MARNLFCLFVSGFKDFAHVNPSLFFTLLLFKIFSFDKILPLYFFIGQKNFACLLYEVKSEYPHAEPHLDPNTKRE